MNLRPYDPAEPLVYLRIPKCAGRSMVFLLARWFGDGFHQLDPVDTCGAVTRIETRDADGNWLPKVRCLYATFDHARSCGLPYYYPEIKQYVTILRDPFDAAVALYFSGKQQSREGSYRFRGRPSDFCAQYPNVASFLKQYPHWYFDHLPVGLDLSNYRQRLAERFVYLGILEDLPGSIESMARLFGKTPHAIPQLNASCMDEPMPESLRVRFYQDYPLLKRIHEFAREHYQHPGAPLI